MKLFFSTAVLALFCLNVFSQQDKSIVPASFSIGEKVVPIIQKIILPTFDMNEIQQQDKVEDAAGLPFRFGKDFEMEIDIAKKGTWNVLSDGTRICRFEIASPNAKFINLFYKHFELKGNSSFFIYNENHSQMLGAFTAKNVLPSKKYATGFLKGEKMILEINEPAEAAGTSKIIISKVVHGYRGIMNRDKDFGDSGFCNNNVNCPEASEWQDQKKGVILTIVDGNRSCSGSLINNVRNDGTPYFLTANHCLFGDYDTWMFVFNYESPTCSSQDGITDENVVGSTLVATDEPSDFALFELYTPPQFYYNVFYSGWSKKDTVSDSCVGIHHPAGDVKKITFDYGTNQSSEYYQTTDDGTHWMIWNWEDGTTEGGSSGSPLFNNQKRIIGQLHGGYASCSTIEQDWYGKLAYSWDNGSLPDTRLKDWLDPDNTDTSAIDGSYFNLPPLSLDVAVLKLEMPSFVCRESIVPVITFRNNGLDTLRALKFYLLLDNLIADSILWTGNLLFSQLSTTSFPAMNPSNGIHQLVCYSSFPNDSLDLNGINDTAKKVTNIIDNEKILFEFRVGTDDYLNFTISDNNGNEIYNGGWFYNENGMKEVCIDTGCYFLNLYDWYGDGINSPDYFIARIGNDTITDNPSFTDSIAIQFCMRDTTTSLPSQIFDKNIIKIFPNPFENKLTIYNSNKKESIFEVGIKDILGKEIFRKRNLENSTIIEINTEHLENGIHILQIKTAKKTTTYKILKIGKK